MSEAEYADVVHEIRLAAGLVERLEMRPPSPKRDLALRVLRTELGRTVDGLRRIPSASHHN